MKISTIPKKLKRRYLSYKLQDALSSHGTSHCKKINQAISAWKWPISVAYIGKNTYKLVDSDNDSIMFCRPSRIHYYKKGIKNRLCQISAEYFINKINIMEGDYVIDVGANIGEFSLSISEYTRNIIAIEPDPVEYSVLEKNLEVGYKLNNALWNEQTKLTFYQANNSGDSSLFRPPGSEGEVEVSCITLSNLFDRYSLKEKGVKLVKLEAEGAEPEILEGLESDCYRYIQYFTVDVGPERGMNKENTLCEVFNFLISKGFKLKEFGFPRMVALFENQKMKKS